MSVHGHRVERLAEQIRDDVAEMIAGELKDPRIGLAAVTGIELSPDLSHARVLVSVLGDEEARAQTLAGLSSAAGYVRRELGSRLGLRRTPEVVFSLDRALDAQGKVESVLEKVKKES
jgi:ribosome-binding factor A